MDLEMITIPWHYDAYVLFILTIAQQYSFLDIRGSPPLREGGLIAPLKQAAGYG